MKIISFLLFFQVLPTLKRHIHNNVHCMAVDCTRFALWWHNVRTLKSRFSVHLHLFFPLAPSIFSCFLFSFPISSQSISFAIVCLHLLHCHQVDHFYRTHGFNISCTLCKNSEANRWHKMAHIYKMKYRIKRMYIMRNFMNTKYSVHMKEYPLQEILYIENGAKEKKTQTNTQCDRNWHFI